MSFLTKRDCYILYKMSVCRAEDEGFFELLFGLTLKRDEKQEMFILSYAGESTPCPSKHCSVALLNSHVTIARSLVLIKESPEKHFSPFPIPISS